MIPLSVARQSQAVIDTTSFQRFSHLYQLRRLTTMLNRLLGSRSTILLGRPMLSVENGSSNIKTNPQIRCLTKRHIQYSRDRFKCRKHKEIQDSRLMCCRCQRQLSTLCKRNIRYFSTKQDDLTNPIDRLQAFIDVPIIPLEDHLFKPSTQEIQSAGKFWNQSMKEIKFLKSVKFLGQLPEDDLPEVTFIGRSNVGKSSLIQTLFRESDVLVKTSKTPGHTRLLNFFEVKKHFRVVDVPGYGYRMPEDYPQMVEEFLKTRPRLVRTFLLLDVVSKLNETDMIGINMVEEFQLPYVKTFLLMDGSRAFTGTDVHKYKSLEEWQIPYVIVITKIDKVSSSVLLRNMLEIQKVMKKAKFCFPQPFLVSAITGEGIPLLQTFVTYVTGNLAIEGM